MNALRRRDFRALWTAGLVSDTGDWMLLVAMPILVYQLTGSTLGTALTFLVELIPPILIGPIAGRLADRWDRRRAMLWLSVAQAMALLPLLAVASRDELWIVYVVVALEATLAALFEPSKNSLLPTLVPAAELVSANSLLAVNANAGRLIGGPVGGVLLAFGDLRTIVIADAMSFLITAVLVARVRPQRTVERTSEIAADAPTDRRRVRIGLLVAGVGAVAQGLFLVLFVPFVEQILHGDAAETGLLRGVQAAGAAVAGLLLGILARRLRPAVLAIAGATVFGLLSLIIWNAPGLTDAEPLYIALFVAVGAPGVIMVTGLVSTLQSAAGPAVRGRVFGAFTAVFAIGQAVGMLVAGIAGDRIGVIPLLNVQGCVYLAAAAVGILLLLRLPLRRRVPGAAAEVCT